MARETLERDEAAKAAQALVFLSQANSVHATKHAGAQTSLGKKLTGAMRVVEFQLEEKVGAFLASPDAAATLESIDKALRAKNAAEDARLAKNPSPNAPFHRPRPGQGEVKSPPGLGAEQK